ncbi:MAG: polysaccharide deacetylase family protein [Actinomycetota bacterium]|nr:polysaccharide deacetylase family protein [Actinomycetota bacterium]
MRLQYPIIGLAVAGILALILTFEGVAGTASQPSRSDARAVDQTLEFTPLITQGGQRHRDVALTFDDGPDVWTARIARELGRLHAPATFFEIGEQVPSQQRLTRGLVHSGFAVGDHTETHPLLAHHHHGFQTYQLRRAATFIAQAGAPYPRLFRPPYGSFNAVTLGILAQMRMLMVLWSADTEDYAMPGVRRIVASGLRGLRPGAIILMHDGGGDRHQTLAALPILVHRLRARGYRLLTIPQLLIDDPPAPGQRVPDGLGPAATAS